MKEIINKLKLEKYSSKFFNIYFGGKTFAVFDIETTGLSPQKCALILSGIMVNNGDNFSAIQLFATNLDDEKLVIEKTINILKSVDYIITYNGKHFDIPFLKTRAEKYGIDTSGLPYNLDIYLIVNGHSDLKEMLPNIKQKSIEQFLGLTDSRDDEISGAELIELYNEYLKSHSQALENKILLHNHDDIIQLYKSLKVIDFCYFSKAMFKLGFTTSKYIIKKIQIKGHDLYVTGRQRFNPKDYISFPTLEAPYSLNMDSKWGEFELTVPAELQSGAIFFDALTILGEENYKKIKKYPSFENGYLIVKDDVKINYNEINNFVLAFFNMIEDKI